MLHWMLSQSIFLTVLATYNQAGLASEILFLGSSPRPLMLSKSGFHTYIGFLSLVKLPTTP
jgi:hypothetical protein